MWNYIYMGLLMLGMLLFYFAYREYNKTQKLVSDGIRTTATVIELIEVHSDDSYTYKPVFQFTDRSHTQQQFTSHVSSNPPAYKVGAKVKVIYSLKDPTEVKIVSFWGLYSFTIVLFCIAAPLLIIGGGYVLYARGL